MKLPWFIRKYIAGPDSFGRHQITARLCTILGGHTVLDVGGEGCLVWHLKEHQVTSTNIDKGGILSSGHSLPFVDNAFDIVVSLDTIEHVPRPMREDFLNEIHRVSKMGFIVCAPLGTAEHIAHEKKLAWDGKIDPESLLYLRQHIEYGLPTPEDIQEWAGQFHGDLFYHGKYTDKGVGGIYSRYVKTLEFICINIISAWTTSMQSKLSREYEHDTNRFILMVRKLSAK